MSNKAKIHEGVTCTGYKNPAQFLTLSAKHCGVVVEDGESYISGYSVEENSHTNITYRHPIFTRDAWFHPYNGEPPIRVQITSAYTCKPVSKTCAN